MTAHCCSIVLGTGQARARDGQHYDDVELCTCLLGTEVLEAGMPASDLTTSCIFPVQTKRGSRASQHVNNHEKV